MADSSTNTPVSPLEAKQEKEDKKDEILARDNQIRELEKQNQELQSKMVNFETQISSASSELEELKSQLAEKQERNLNLQKQLDVFVNVAKKDVGVQTLQTLTVESLEPARKMTDMSLKSGSAANGSLLQVKGGDMSLSLSNQSNLGTENQHSAGFTKPQLSRAQSLGQSSKAPANAAGPGHNKESNEPPKKEQTLKEEIDKHVQQNKDLQEACSNMEDEVHYLRLREKKIMHLVHLMQSKGYPVQNMYEQELKNVHTLRIQEYLDNKEKEMYEMEHGGPEIDEKYYFSFHTDDSFEPIADGPMLRPERPGCVPVLDFAGLPEYETSSEEDEEEEDEEDGDGEEHESQQQAPDQYQYGSLARPKSSELPGHSGNSSAVASSLNQANPTAAPFHYQESMKYISEFYEKYNGSQYQQDGSSIAPGDEEGDGKDDAAVDEEEYSGAFDEEEF